MKQKWMKGTLIVLITLLAFELGGAFYEWIVVASQWSSYPPQSFSILQGEYALPLDSFWMPLHMVAQFVIVLSLILCWKDKQRRKFMLILVGLYIALRVPTFMYFIPELEFFRTTSTDTAWSQGMQDRADRWVLLSIGRTAIIAVSYVLAWMALSVSTLQTKVRLDNENVVGVN
ncbi:hypothetical protein [Bacillus horti]|uniref:DUF1772 domain-containing protein n=1 Tax=Caldalkalibacillus horti TaxID=77523 RepID=A0ABT9W5A2_9BACI|nr:hypothetical protein [Bacillus horti]MDQ0168426.1 hypothetical protein [Bacillus horti]